jgi:hypothetical protein
MKPRKFKVHFNRINMQRGLPGVWTVHISKRCIPAREVIICVPVNTVFRPNGRQPRAWFEGEGFVHELNNGIVALEATP